MGRRGAAEVPVEDVKGLGHGVPGYDFGEELELLVTLVGVWEVGDGGVAAGSDQYVSKVRKGTYGQERMETKAMPMMRAYLTRKAMRKAVTIPPHRIPTQSYTC